MLIKKVPINFINNTPLSISIYQAGKTIPHMHNDILEIIYCLKGDITITVTHEQLDFHTGDLYIINSRDVHSVESRSKEDNLIASFYINLDVYKRQVESIRMRIGKATHLPGEHEYDWVLRPWNPGWSPKQALIDCCLLYTSRCV